jgi:hypothetical protein
MAITRARTSSVAQGPSTRKTVLGGNDVILGGSYDAIGTVVVGAGGQSTITFSSIPGTYKHLQIRAIAKASGTNFNPMMRFNSDTGSNYSWHYIYGDGNTASAGGGTSQTFIYNSITSTNANIYNGFIIDILDYANTSKFKTTRELSGQDRNSNGEINFFSGNWRSTSAVTSITFSNGTFDQYSQFDLYGIK